MPRYFIHITEGEDSIPDDEGIERADLAAVRQTVIEGAGALVGDAVREGGRDYRVRLDVEDERGTKVLALALACSVQLDIGPQPDGSAKPQLN